MNIIHINMLLYTYFNQKQLNVDEYSKVYTILIYLNTSLVDKAF